MPGEFCPRCGTPRTGSFRFCRSCGLDFEADAPPAAESTLPPTENPSAPPKQQPPASLAHLTVLAQAQNLLTPAAAIAGFLIGAGVWTMILGADSVGSAIGALVAGLVVAWALGTWVQVYFGNKILRGMQGPTDGHPRG